jgi:hypothetical protein
MCLTFSCVTALIVPVDLKEVKVRPADLTSAATGV